jgi:glycosyltransferase involved in cell wall biosynthesis
VIGMGPETAMWKRLATSLGVTVHWLGRLEHNQALAEMNRADVFFFSSLQEATSTVVMEALSIGLPVICHDACGMGVAVTDDSGIKVSLIDPQTSIAGFAAALDRLLQKPTEVSLLSEGALSRSKQMTWDAKITDILRAYEQVLGRSEALISDLSEVYSTQ